MGASIAKKQGRPPSKFFLPRSHCLDTRGFHDFALANWHSNFLLIPIEARGSLKVTNRARFQSNCQGLPHFRSNHRAILFLIVLQAYRDRIQHI